MKSTKTVSERIKAIPPKDRMALIQRNDVPKDLFDAIQGELYPINDCTHYIREETLDLQLYLSIKNYLAHRLDPEAFAKIFPESMS